MSKKGSKRSFIDSVEVKSPCSEDWEQMSGNDRVRFCSHCSKHVNNLSEMTQKEAARLVSRSGANLCIRYIPHPVTGRPMFAQQLLQITRRAPRLTAGVMSASLSLSTLAYSQSGSDLPDPQIVAEQKAKKDVPTSESRPVRPTRLRGTVTDPNGAVIPNARVSIMGIQVGTLTTTTNGEGEYQFDDLKPGRYMIETESPGFLTSTSEAMIAEQADTVADASLGIGFEVTVNVVADVSMDVGMGGAVAFVSYSSVLNKAIVEEDIDRVRQLLTDGEDVNGLDENYEGIRPLFVAVKTGDVDIVQLLLDSGAQIDAVDADKQTPLMHLDDSATPELVELLVRYGARLSHTDDEHNSVLMTAIDNYATAAVVDALVRAGADVRVGNKTGTTALMTAAARDNLEIVQLLVEAGAEVNAKDEDGETAYSRSSDEEVKQYLIAHGARVDPD